MTAVPVTSAPRSPGTFCARQPSDSSVFSPFLLALSGSVVFDLFSAQPRAEEAVAYSASPNRFAFERASP